MLSLNKMRLDMKFTGAMNAIRKGKKVTRDGKTSIYMAGEKMLRLRGKNETEARFTQQDIEGEWSVVKVSVLKKTVAKKKTKKKKAA
jgi:hypothetical protein